MARRTIPPITNLAARLFRCGSRRRRFVGRFVRRNRADLAIGIHFLSRRDQHRFVGISLLRCGSRCVLRSAIAGGIIRDQPRTAHGQDGHENGGFHQFHRLSADQRLGGGIGLIGAGLVGTVLPGVRPGRGVNGERSERGRSGRRLLRRRRNTRVGGAGIGRSRISCSRVGRPGICCSRISGPRVGAGNSACAPHRAGSSGSAIGRLTQPRKCQRASARDGENGSFGNHCLHMKFASHAGGICSSVDSF